MMKKIVMSVYAACAMLVIAGSLLWFVFTLHSDAAVGKTRALNNFKIFTRHVGEIISESAQETDPVRLQSRFEQLCRNYQKYIQAVAIKDPTGIVFIWPKETDIFSYTEQYTIEVKNLPLFATAAQTHIPISKTGNTATVHAALRMIPVETIFNRGQIVFFLLLLIVLMTVIVLIFSYIIRNGTVQHSDHPNEQTTQYHTEPISSEAAPLTADTLYDKHQIDCENPTDHKEPVPKDHTAKATEAATPLHEQLESLNRLHIYDGEPARQIQAVPQESRNEPCAPETTDIPEAEKGEAFGAENYGWFENHSQTIPLLTETQEPVEPPPVTSFENTPLADTAHSDSHSLEQATLIEELTTAITETAVAEEDLTLMLIHAADISHNQQIIHLLRATLDRIHKIFIFNKDTLGVIIFYAPLDQAMQIASSLYDEIHVILEEPTKKSFGIGFTTRAGRLLPAPRMIEEAAAAIAKATEEGSDPIVAFRVNPDKYRRCLARLS